MGTFVHDVRPEEVDVVVAALQPDIAKFLELWRPMLQPYHLIVVGGSDFEEKALRVPEGFHADVYTQGDIAKLVGPELAASLGFAGYGCKSFGYLVAKRQYVVTLDADCAPAKDPAGNVVDPVVEHVRNLKNPATPFFFNTLYDPYRKGADFVRGYPFSLREGVPTAVSHGLWLNAPDYDAPTLARLKQGEELNSKYVDAVLTVPKNVLYPMSGINLAFDRSLVGPAMYAGQLGAAADTGSNALRCNGIDDIWAGLCCKLICDHFGYGVKSGLPYVFRNSTPQELAALQKDFKGFQWMQQIVHFFETAQLSSNALEVEDCYLELANQVDAKLSSVDPAFGRLALSMKAWIQAWKKLSSA